MLEILQIFLLVYMICLNFVEALILNLMKMMKAHYLLSISIQTDNMLQSKFKEFGWGCKSFHNKPCSDVVDFHSTFNHRDHCRALSHDELHLVIKF